MIESYNFKIIRSGKEIETYHYEKRIFRGFTKKKSATEEQVEAQEKISPAEWEELVEIWGDDVEKTKLKTEQRIKTASSIARTRTNIRRLVNANAHLNQFLTLTFAESMPELKRANVLFDRAMKRIIWKYPGFQYIAVNEFQGDTNFRTGETKPEGGSVHYHLLCNLGPKDTSKAAMFAWERKFAVKYWRNGFVKIVPIEHVTNMGAYFCKYLSKDMFDKRMFRKKKFFCSQSLNKPVEMTGNEALGFFNRYVKPLNPIFEKTFKSDWTGKVEYKAYTLIRDYD